MPDLPPPCHRAPADLALLLTAHLPLPHPDRAAKRASPTSPSVGPDSDSSSPLMPRLDVVLPPHRHADARVRGSIRLGVGLAQCLQHTLKVATSADQSRLALLGIACDIGENLGLLPGCSATGSSLHCYSSSTLARACSVWHRVAHCLRHRARATLLTGII
jgi:hypothetical protein